MITSKIDGYRTSRDYAKLWEAAKESSVVCIVDYTCPGHAQLSPSRHVCHTMIYDDTHPHHSLNMEISAHGICYIGPANESEFAKECEAVSLEWIVPTKEPVLKYNGTTYPFSIECEEGYEIQDVLAREISGDYFLIEIKSSGELRIIEEVGKNEVTYE